VRPTLVITHLADRDSGLVEDALMRAAPVRRFDALAAEPLPALHEIAGIVTLGGRQSATAVASDPALAAEVALLRRALDEEVPVLGFCLGAQLLAVAGGGHVRALGEMRAGWPQLRRLPSCAQDPVFAEFPDELRVLRWHEDLIEAPGSATQLGTTPGPGDALYRLGAAAWGSQAHLELTPALLVDTWLTQPRGVVEVQAAGHRIDDFARDSRRLLAPQMAAARRALQRFAILLRRD